MVDSQTLWFGCELFLARIRSLIESVGGQCWFALAMLFFTA